MKIRAIGALAVAAAILTAGCAVPLGPGYRFATRRSEVSGVSDASAHVHVRISDTLRNNGNRDLSFLEVTPPVALGANRLTVRVAGAEAHTLAANADSDPTVRLLFAPPWPQGEERNVIFDYDVPANSNTFLSGAAADGFYLADPAPFPTWSPPPGPFADGDLRALAERLQVTVPSDWLVLGAGADRHKTLLGGFSLHEFRTAGEDVPPFIIAGRFQESRIHTGSGVVIVWTLKPLDSEAAKMAAERLSSAAAAYEDAFGPLPAGARSIRIVEMPGEAPATNDTAGAPPAASFPGGVLLRSEVFAQGLNTEPVMQLAERELARTWFGWRVYPSTDSQLGMGMTWFPAVLAAEARGGAMARQHLVAQLIEAYDSDARGARPTVSAHERLPLAMKQEHAALFCVALQDLAGKENFARAMKRIMQSMAGHEVGDEELRSALESETGLDLAETFRTWLHQRGLPADFRARYASKQ